MQAMWFPLPLALCAPLQIGFGLLRLWGARGMACFLKSDPSLSRAAVSLCDAAAAAKRLVLALGGGGAGVGGDGDGVGGGGRARACEEAPVEFLISLAVALACLLPVRARAPRGRGPGPSCALRSALGAGRRAQHHKHCTAPHLRRSCCRAWGSACLWGLTLYARPSLPAHRA